jgi:hypothetical protein
MRDLPYPMDVIPLTLAISLLLSLTFIALFVREFTRPRPAGAARDSLLPLESEHATVSAVPVQGHGHSHTHHDEVCASKRTDGECCSSCQRRKDKAAARTTRAADGLNS